MNGIATSSAAPLRITLAPEPVIRGSTAAPRALSRKAARVRAA
ncbi:hypothetical protein [Paraburkholderia oxyphila]|nr:hypothetical protein [Paraburkholderia oxyphila]